MREFFGQTSEIKMPKLNGKVSLITGASRGIGKEIALLFAEEGSLVYTISRTKCEFEHKNIIPIQADITDEKKIEEIFNDIKKLDILVNNAGVTKDNLFLRLKLDDFRDIMEVNFFALVRITKNAVKLMLKQKEGKIINISSVVGVYGNFGQSNYAASKAAIIGFTKTLAKELGRYKILVNCICPGFIETQMTDKLKEEIKQEIKNRIALGRFGNPKEVAKLALFLASDDNTYITGQAIIIDGGLF